MLTSRRRQFALFQSTLPTRGSDGHIYRHAIAAGISIHAPHEGERQFFCTEDNTMTKFQSTLPTRGSDKRIIVRMLYNA